MFPTLTRFFLASLMACASSSHNQDSKTVAVKEAAPAKKAKKINKKEEKKSQVDQELSEVEKKYAAAKSVSMDVKKSLILSLLERTDVYDGRFFLSGKDKLRLEFEKPVKSIAVLNGKEFWVIEYPPADTNEKVRVLKSSMGEKSQSQVLITSLLGQGRILDHFTIESKKKNDGKITYKLKAAAEITEVQNLELVVDEEKKLITELAYQDELENRTRFEFSKIEFDGDVPEKLFTFSPPKGAEVSHL
jgi:outer membrane lipoprotein-sorting protein